MSGISKIQKKGLKNVAVRISQKRDISIRFSQRESAFTNGQIITLGGKIAKNLKPAQGVIAHEAGHIGYGSFDRKIENLKHYLNRKYGLSPNTAFSLINVVEDCRIDLINSRIFPGFYRNLRNFVAKEVLPGLIGRKNLLVDLNLYLEGGYKDWESFPNEDYGFTEKELGKLEKAKKLVRSNSSPIMTVMVCDLLGSIIAKGQKRHDVDTITEKSPDIECSREDKSRGRNKTDDEKKLEQMIDDIIKELEKIDEETKEEVVDEIVDEKELEEEEEDSEGKGEGKEGEGKEGEGESEGEGSGEGKEGEEESEEGEGSGEGKEGEEESEEGEGKEGEGKEGEGESEEGKGKEGEGESEEGKGKEEKSVKPVELREIDETERLSEEELETVEEITGYFDEKKEEEKKKLRELIDEAEEIIEEKIEKIEEGYTELEASSIKPRDVIEYEINESVMKEYGGWATYNEIVRRYRRVITKMTEYFSELRTSPEAQKFQKSGRLNNMVIRTVTSNYTFKRCFTKKIHSKVPKMCLLIDVSGSMSGNRMTAAKTAMVVLAESLKNICDLRVILFSGRYEAVNIVVKDYGKEIEPKNFDLFGHWKDGSQNVDGESVLYEANKINDRDGVLVVVSDGRPAADRGYGVKEALPHFESARKKVKKIFAYSVDARGEWLELLYGERNYLEISSFDTAELMNKLVRFSRMVMTELLN